MKIDEIGTIIQSVGPIRPSSPLPFETDAAEGQPATFGEMLKTAVDKVNTLQTNAREQEVKLAMGEVANVHDVMIALEKASLALQFTQAVRDSVVDAFKTLMRTAM